MRRAIVLGAVIAAGVLSAAAAAYRGQPQAPKVAEIEKVTDNLYVVKGGGGNTAAFVTERGVVVVDTKLAGWGQAILDKIKSVTDKPVTTIINTHTHGDHTGSNEFFGATVDIVAHENTKANMERMDAFKGEGAKFLPKKTYRDRMSLMSGKDRIDLYYFGRGHTSGDTWVVFPALRAMHAGDLFSDKTVPIVDSAVGNNNGGSGIAYPETLAKAVAGIKDVDTIITGHSTKVMTWADLQEYAQFMRDFVAWTGEQMKAGKSVDEAAAAFQIPAKYRDYTAQAPRVKQDVQTIFNELKK